MKLSVVPFMFAFAATAFAGDLSSSSPCDPKHIDPRSWSLVTRGQAMNVLRPRHDGWDSFELGKYADDLDDLNLSATRLAQRALEIDPGNDVLWFKLTRPIRVSSDRTGKTKTLDQIKVALHGRTGELEVYKPVGEDHLAMRGRGPASYQDLVRRTMVKFVDPERRIQLPPSRPGVGW